MPIRTHRREFICTICQAGIPIPNPFPGWEEINRILTEFERTHDCQPREEGYLTEQGVRVIDRRFIERE
jgi:hypothetical protein